MGLDALVCFKDIGGFGVRGALRAVLVAFRWCCWLVWVLVGGLRLYGAIHLLFVVVSPGFAIGLWLF